MYKVRTVIDFEVLRAIKKKSFWYTSLAPPLIILAIIGISTVSANNANKASQQQANTLVKTSKIAVLDDTGLINKQQLVRQHIILEPTKQAGIAAVEADKLDAFFYYPKDVTKSGIDIYAKDQGIINTPPYSDAAIQLLKLNVLSGVSSLTHNDQMVQLLQNDPNVTTTTYKNGKQTNGTASLIAPGVFLLAFLALIVLSAYFMLASTTEEKENRAAEILLTAIKSRSLILGKILSIFILGIVQLLIILVPLLIGYALFRNHVSLPGGVSLSHVPLSAQAITFGLLFFVAGNIMFTSYLVGFSALFPSAQEAGRYLGLAIIWAFLPLYTLKYIISSPHSLVVKVFTYFPLTAPATALLRNTFGAISVTESLISLAIIVASAAFAIAFAIRAFRYGAMEYGRRVGVKELFR